MPKLTALLSGMLWYSIAFAQPSPDLHRLDSVLTQLNRGNHFNGTILYAENGKVLYRKAFGVTDIRTGTALETRSAFNLASISKQFVDVCILKLADQGKLKLDDPVKKYIPELPYEGITLRNLMTHTSGLPEYFDLFTRYRGTLDTLDNDGMIRLFATHHPPLDFPTGTSWQYCNTNYILLASIVERVSEQSFPVFFHEQIAAPLGLKDTYAYTVKMRTTPANHVYGFQEVNGKKQLYDLINADGVIGDGNIYSSVEDLFRWEQAYYGEKLVKKETLAQMFSPVKLNNGSTYPYGFGWFIGREGEYYWHTGSWQGFKNLICRDVKQHRTLIVLSSGEETTGRLFAKALFEGKTYSLPHSWLITHVVLVDGTGILRRSAAVRVTDDKITEVGDLLPLPGEDTFDGGGKVLAPGFIDSHSHVEGSLSEYPQALAAVNQGVTTIVSGQDGYGSYIDSIKAHFARRPAAINVATYTGQTFLRELAMGPAALGRPCTPEELEKMKRILEAELKKGSLGLSTGLEYAGAYFSTRDEVLELAKTTAAGHGRYISHMRSEDIGLPDALDEIISIGREARLPVQISHMKIALKDGWGTSPQMLAQLVSARREGIDITADCYPYVFWHSTLRVLFPKTDYTNLVSAQFAVDHTVDADQSVVNVFAPVPAYAGKTVSEIAAIRKETPARTLISLIALCDTFERLHPDVDNVEGIIGKSMAEEDVTNFLSWDHTAVCSDGENGGHPRGYGTFTRVLGRYVRERKVMSLETAIHKMTGLAAEQVGIKDRGIIAPGYYADLVLLDPETVLDNSEIKNSKALSTGIGKVWVNGVLVYSQGTTTGQYPGAFVSR